MAKKLYPFSATWSGLTKKGKEREIAQAKYELSGIELKKKLAVIDADTVEDKAVFVTTKVPSISGVDVDTGRLN